MDTDRLQELNQMIEDLAHTHGQATASAHAFMSNPAFHRLECYEAICEVERLLEAIRKSILSQERRLKQERAELLAAMNDTP
jgi:hypothetical protein